MVYLKKKSRLQKKSTIELKEENKLIADARSIESDLTFLKEIH